MKGKPKRRQPRILIVGCGDVGLRIAALLKDRFTLLGTVRDPDRQDVLRAAGVIPLLADLDRPDSLWRLRGLAPAVIHLAPPTETGVRDLRSRHLIGVLGRPKRMVYISTSGVYGDCAGAIIDETRTPDPVTPRAQRRLDAERTLRSWAKTTRVHLSILRVPGIYASQRLPLQRLRDRSPTLLAAEDVYTNHIHADDLARIAVLALWRGSPQRIYHACDDSKLLMGDYFDLIADYHGLPRPPRVNRLQLAEVASPSRYSFMQESRRLQNIRLKRELAFTLCYPRIEDGLRASPMASSECPSPELDSEIRAQAR